MIKIFLTQRRKERLKYIFKKQLKGLACFASPLHHPARRGQVIAVKQSVLISG